MMVQDLKDKYIGMTFEVKHLGKTGKCLNVKGYRDPRSGLIIFRWCLEIGDRAVWFQTVEVEPVRETLF